MANIYQLPNEVQGAIERYYSLFDSETGELLATEEELQKAQDAIKELENRSNEAMEWMLKTRTNEKAEIAGIDSEIERLTNLKNATSRRLERIESLIERNFERIYGGEAMQIGNFKLSYRKSQAVKVLDEAKIPKEFIREKITESVDKDALKKRLKSGETIAWVELEHRQFFTIK